MPVVKNITIECFKEFEEEVAKLKPGEPAILLFTSTPDPSTGENFCPDCVKAHPVIGKASADSKPDWTLITCHVGGRSVWKDPKNAFRTSPRTQLKSIPTLMVWNTVKRLGESDCANSSLVEMLFEGEDD